MATRKYEIMVILDPSRSEEQQQETLTHIEEVITKYGGTPEKRDVWGKRRLAFSINKRRDGYYAVIYFDVEPTSKVLAELELYCKIREEILRSLVTQSVVGMSKGDPALVRQYEAQRAAAASYGRQRREERSRAAAPERTETATATSAPENPEAAAAEPAAETPAPEPAPEAAPETPATPETTQE